MNKAILLALSLVYGTAHAAGTTDLPPHWNQVRHYAEMTKGGPQRQLLIAAYLNGAGFAFFTANSRLTAKNQPRLYCQPHHMPLQGTDYIRIFDRELARWGANPPDTILAWDDAEVLLFGLERSFPCTSPKPARR